MKQNRKNLEEMLAANAAEAIKTVKEAAKASKSSTKEETPVLTPIKSKKTASKKEEVTKEVAKQQKADITEKVVSQREVKWKYPEDCSDTLARKKWRQQQRNELHKLEREFYRIKDQNSKEYKAAKKKFEDFQAKVLKPQQTA